MELPPGEGAENEPVLSYKPGSHLNLLRWVSPGTIKETLIPATDYKYPFMGHEKEKLL